MPGYLLHSDDYAGSVPSGTGCDLRCLGTPDLAARALAEDGFVVVATFDWTEPWEVYRNTHNAGRTPCWSRWPAGGLRPVGPGTVRTRRGEVGYRATSTGDAVIVDGTMYVLGRYDFDRVDAPLPDRLRGIDGSEFRVTSAPRP